MLNEASILKLWVDIRDKGKRIRIPLIIWLQCLTSYIDDIADMCALLPDNMRINVGKREEKTFAQATAMLNVVSTTLRSMKGLRVRTNIKSGDKGFVNVNIEAI